MALACAADRQPAAVVVPAPMWWPDGITPLPAPDDVVAAEVTAVIDGDTITVRIAAGPAAGSVETVRLLGIDTPEKAGGPRPAECHGQAATDFTDYLIPPGTEVQLAAGQETRDQYGRLLAFVFRRGDGTLVNQALVAQGHATALFYAPNTELEPTFQAAAMTARRERLGFWSTCGGLPGPIQTQGG